MKKVRIYFRLKGGLLHGWGHIIRSSILSRHFSESRVPTQAMMAVEGTSTVESFMRTQGAPFIMLKGRSSLKEEERALNNYRPDIIIVDMLKAPQKLLSLYRRHCGKLVIFNDLGLDYRLGDVVITPQLLSAYPRDRKGQIHLNGPRYFILSEDILKARAKIASRVSVGRARSLIIIMGGCTERRIFECMKRVVENIALPDLKISFVLGYENNVPRQAYRDLNARGVRFISGVDAMGKLMSGADMALASSGYVKYELAALGVPSLLLSVIRHQKKLVKTFVKETKCAEYLGGIHETDPINLAERIRGLAADRQKRREMGMRGRRLVDGKALDRIAKELLLCKTG